MARFNGTITQVQIYYEGPYQALNNFTPAYVHAVGNNTGLVKEYREKIEQAQQSRTPHNCRETGVTLSTFDPELV